MTGTETETDTDTETKTDEPTPTDEPSSLEIGYNSRERFGSPGTSFDRFEDLSVWTSLRGSLTADSTTVFSGSQSAKIVGTDGGHAIIERAFDSPMDFSETDISFALFSTTPIDVSFFVYLIDVAGNYAVLELRNITLEPPDVGWFRTCPGVFTVSETPPDLSRIERIRMQAYNSGGDTVSVWLDDLRTHPKPKKGYIVLSWDDGKHSYYEKAAPVHDRYDVPAVHAVIPPFVGHGPFMPIEELRERQDAGDEIVAHASIRNRFHELSASKLDALLRRNKRWLLEHGFEEADFIVYPGNDYDATSLEVTTRYHTMGGMNQAFNVNTTGVYGFDPLVLPRTVGNQLPHSKRVVDYVAAYRNCGILNFHDFSSSNTMSVSEYRELISYIARKGDAVEVITFSELWEMRTSRS